MRADLNVINSVFKHLTNSKQLWCLSFSTFIVSKQSMMFPGVVSNVNSAWFY